VVEVDQRLIVAMRKQLSRRPAAAARIGWKYGGGGERIDREIAVGHLTSETIVSANSPRRGG
jgi:hypothetical protein